MFLILQYLTELIFHNNALSFVYEVTIDSFDKIGESGHML